MNGFSAIGELAIAEVDRTTHPFLVSPRFSTVLSEDRSTAPVDDRETFVGSERRQSIVPPASRELG